MSAHRSAAITSLVAVLLGIGIAAAGGDGGDRLGPFPLFAWVVIAAFAINVVAYVPALLARTEHYFDLVGSLTYLSVTTLALAGAAERDLRTVMLALMIAVWAARLGSFLFRRVRQTGGDGRFDQLKLDPVLFLRVWMLQAVWVSLTGGAAFAAMTSGHKVPFGIVGALGLAVWVAGFVIEARADHQKQIFRRNSANDGRFIDHGWWARSRHPNYFGEIVLWLGVAITAGPALHGWQFATLISPVFVFVLLRYVSGVPALERRADKRWGGQTDYETYKATTPLLVPNLTRR